MRPVEISVTCWSGFVIRVSQDPDSRYHDGLRNFARPRCVLAPGRAYLCSDVEDFRGVHHRACTVAREWTTLVFPRAKATQTGWPWYFVGEALTTVQAKHCCPSLGDLGSRKIPMEC